MVTTVTETELRRERLARSGWIGVDLDGTILTYHKWVGWNVFGEPIRPMVDRIHRWFSEGRDVRIVTARVGLPLFSHDGILTYGRTLKHMCHITGEEFSDTMMVQAIQQKLEPILGRRGIQVQCFKDVSMIELWDDRAVQVVPNTGQTLAEQHVAELSALRGKVFTPEGSE